MKNLSQNQTTPRKERKKRYSKSENIRKRPRERERELGVCRRNHRNSKKLHVVISAVAASTPSGVGYSSRFISLSQQFDMMTQDFKNLIR